MSLRRELWANVTRPSRYINTPVFALVVAMLVLVVFVTILNIAFEHWLAAAFTFIVVVIYALLAYQHWPWRKS